MIRVAVCSSSPALRAGLSALVNAHPELETAAASSRLEDLPPGVQVIVATPDALGARGGEEDTPLLLVTDDPGEAAALSDAGRQAWGVISPDAPGDALQAAVQALASGLVVASPEMLLALLERSAGAGEYLHAVSAGEEPTERLTGREVDVLVLLARGLTNKAIALALGISEHTVKFHVSSIYGKLGVSNRAEAVRKGARQGLVPL